MEIMALPDSLADEAVFGLETGRRAYLNLAEALAVSSPVGSAVQLRLHTDGARGQVPGRVRPWVLGVAVDEADAVELRSLVLSTLDGELTVAHAPTLDVPSVFGFFPNSEHVAYVEVRRRLEDADVGRRPSGDTVPLQAAVLDWAPERFALRKAVEMLSTHPSRAAICLHVERAIPDEALLDHLADTVNLLRFDPDRQADELSAQILREAIRAQRDLPRAALRVRIGVAGVDRVTPGLPESVGMDLTGTAAFEVIRPDGADVFDAVDLWVCGRASWDHPDIDGVAGDLIEITSAASAGAVVRFPQPPVGGLPAIATTPLTTLPRSPQDRRRVSEETPRVAIGAGVSGGSVDLTLQELNQHVLIAGLPGFGKTTTVQEILRRLWLDHSIPFLVLDPAKSDYSMLATELADRGVERVVLHPSSPAFNPFGVPAGCDVAAHAARVVGAFDAALRLSEQWPLGFIVLSRAVFRCYEDVADGTPTLRMLYRVLGDMIRAEGFSREVASNLRGSLLGRLESLVRGPLGAAFTADAESVIDWDTLLRRPTVVEFRAFAGPTERSLVFGLLIAGIASYRESHPPAGTLTHVTVLEEAHRVLSNRSVVQSDGIRLLVEAVAELRGSGEGFIIADQAPSTLDPTLRKVTGSVVAHRVVDREERELIGDALLLHPRQADDLARLDVGVAVVYGAQRSQSVVCAVTRPTPPATGVATSRPSLAAGTGVDPLFCIGCPSICTGRAWALANLPVSDEEVISAQTRAMTMFGRGEIERAEARCLVGHVLARSDDPPPPPRFLSAMNELERQLDDLARARRHHRRNE